MARPAGRPELGWRRLALCRVSARERDSRGRQQPMLALTLFRAFSSLSSPPRYILVYPQGCDVCNHLSLFLCVADYDKLLPGECDEGEEERAEKTRRRRRRELSLFSQRKRTRQKAPPRAAHALASRPSPPATPSGHVAGAARVDPPS